MLLSSSHVNGSIDDGISDKWHYGQRNHQMLIRATKLCSRTVTHLLSLPHQLYFEVCIRETKMEKRKCWTQLFLIIHTHSQTNLHFIKPQHLQPESLFSDQLTQKVSILSSGLQRKPQAYKSIWMENRVLPEGWFFALIAEETQNESFHGII